VGGETSEEVKVKTISSVLYINAKTTLFSLYFPRLYNMMMLLPEQNSSVLQVGFKFRSSIIASAISWDVAIARRATGQEGTCGLWQQGKAETPPEPGIASNLAHYWPTE
jgi:hypothetical protein